MISISIVVVAVLLFTNVATEKSITKEKVSNMNLEYKGQKFPKKYLEPDPQQPALLDLMRYIRTLNKTIDYFIALNDSDVNIALGAYFCKAALKRALLDYRDTLVSIGEYVNVKNLIWKTETVVDQRTYVNNLIVDKNEYTFSQVLRFDDALVHTMGDYNRNRLTQYIYTKSDMNDYLEAIDDASLDKFTYIDLIESMELYHVNIEDSDWCLTTTSYSVEPVDMSKPFTRCKPDPYCEDALHLGPSIAYSLSHRMLNVLMRCLSRRCFMKSEEFDRAHLDYLCSFMFREAIYKARRGFFSRDTFMEHIALCGLMGYEEFHRTSWFRKILSWVDENGCTAEFENFEINRTKIYVARSKDPVRHAKVRDRLAKLRVTNCHHHPMALLASLLGLAIRHALHHLTNSQLLD